MKKPTLYLRARDDGKIEAITSKDEPTYIEWEVWMGGMKVSARADNNAKTRRFLRAALARMERESK